ncbi:hypothetical protein DL93DRAFT_604228 [Clavulina sp. PMI_390]|nr:hypothetical protein DL93DRAFT_604228 [Clavulina sp. PMI_390]
MTRRTLILHSISSSGWCPTDRWIETHSPGCHQPKLREPSHQFRDVDNLTKHWRVNMFIPSSIAIVLVYVAALLKGIAYYTPPPVPSLYLTQCTDLHCCIFRLFSSLVYSGACTRMYGLPPRRPRGSQAMRLWTPTVVISRMVRRNLFAGHAKGI